MARWLASAGTMGAGLVLAARVWPQLIGWAFVVLTATALIWIVIGYLAGEYALMAQNIATEGINVFGIYRWLTNRRRVRRRVSAVKTAS